jgi:hypothetical protein
MATGNDIMTAICVGRKGNLIEPNVTVYICERETEEITDHSQNQNLGTLKRRTSKGGYENHLNIQKEKEKEQKRIENNVWKLLKVSKIKIKFQIKKLIKLV